MAAMPGPSRADPHCGHTGNWHPPAAARPLGTGLSALRLLCQASCNTGRMGRGGWGLHRPPAPYRAAGLRTSDQALPGLSSGAWAHRPHQPGHFSSFFFFKQCPCYPVYKQRFGNNKSPKCKRTTWVVQGVCHWGWELGLRRRWGVGQPSGDGEAVMVTKEAATEEGEALPGQDPAHPGYVWG